MNTKVLHISNPSQELLKFVKQLQMEKEEKLRAFQSTKANSKNK